MSRGGICVGDDGAGSLEGLIQTRFEEASCGWIGGLTNLCCLLSS